MTFKQGGLAHVGVLICAGLAVTPSHAYPIYYKCDAKKQMTEVLAGPELMQKLRPLLALPKAQQSAALAEACGGFNECQNQLGQVLEATQIDKNIAEKLYEDELKKLNPDSGVQKLDETSFNYEKQMLAAGFGESACRQTIEDLPPDSFKGNRDNVFIYYPHFSQYTYATGCRPYPNSSDVGSASVLAALAPTRTGARDVFWQCDDNSASILEAAIRKAVIGGVDPYFAIAIGLMENGANGVGQLYLDPIGRETALGCTTHHADATTPGVLDSYHTYYKVDAGVVQNVSLSARLSKAMQALQPGQTGQPMQAQTAKGYYCQDTSNQAQGSIHSSPDKNQCCVQVDLPNGALENPSNNLLLQAADGQLMMDFLRNTENSQLPGKTDPAFRMQHFNGFSRLMGGAEGVSVLLSVLNFFNTPAYGYQGMDFVLNSLVSNPYIRRLVDKITKETGSHYPSILCEDVAVPGTYQIDSDNYYKKNRDAPRLEILQGKSWSAMGPSEKHVMGGELADPPVKNLLEKHFGTLPTDFDSTTQTASGTKITFPNGSFYTIAGYTKEGFTATLPTKPHGDLPESTDQLASDVQSGAIPIDPAKAKNGISVSFQSGANESATFQGAFTPPPKWNVVNPLQFLNSLQLNQKQYPFTYNFDHGALVLQHEMNPNSPGFVSVKVLSGPTDSSQQMAIMNKSQDEKIEFADHSGLTIHTSCAPMSSCLAQQYGQNYQLSYANGPGIKVQFGNLNTLDKEDISVESKNSPTMDQVLAFYFKNIYSSRNTVGKASPITWGDLTEDQLKTISGRFQTSNVPVGGSTYGGVGVF